MDFYAMLDQVLDLLRQRGRVTYRALKLQFTLDDDQLEALKDELLYAHPQVVDDAGRGLRWTGAFEATPPPATAPAPAQDRAPLTYTPAHLVEKILTSRALLEGERKQVTVLFADIKDSTEIIRDLDPEAAQQLLDPAIHIMMDAVHRYEGTVDKVLGDGIMALFGAPIAQEDHALHACYAALAMQAAMQPYAEEVRRRHGATLSVRVGLNAGEVVMRAIGDDLRMDYSAVGQTVHMASRMEPLAPPGSILLPAATMRLVEGLVRVKALGPLPVKGLAEPVEGHELVGVSPLRRRLQAAVLRGLTRFVGREPELAELTRALERAGAGHGQVVAIVGEAGVGKSRLVYECLYSSRTQGWRALEAASVSYGKATSYVPVIDLLKRYAQVDDHDDPRTVRAKVTGHVLTLDDALQEILPALLSLLEVLPENSAFRNLDPPQRLQRTLEALQRLLLRESQVQPLLLVFEDLHWIDAETQALLDSLVERLPTAQLLLLVNYRPEYRHGWGSKTYYTQLRLDPLEPASAAEVVQALLGDDPSLMLLKQLLIERTDGNPFFLEESVRTLVETQVLVGEPGAYRLAQALSTIQVPATVQAVLAARIDRLLPEDKRLLQTAAAIGSEVSLPLLQAIAELPEADLHRGLARLQAAEFLYETRLFPEREFTFKHALTHEVAYGILLQERRRALNAHIVAAIEQLYADRLAEQVERLAQYAVRGEVWEKAYHYLSQAGTRAFVRSVNRDAVAYWEQALAALRELPESRDRIAQAIDLRFELRNALYRLREHERLLNHLRQAETDAEALDDQRRLARVALYLTQHFRMVEEDLDRALASGQRALAIATALKDFRLEVGANFLLSQIYHNIGDYARAIDLARRNIEALTGDLLYERFGFAGVTSVFSRTYLLWSLAERGEFREGVAPAEEAVRIAEMSGELHSRAFAYSGVGRFYLGKGDLQQTIPALERSLSISREAEVLSMIPNAAADLGYAYVLAGRLAEGLPLLEQSTTSMGLRIALLSEAYLLAGRPEAALPLATRALALAREYKARGNQAWALRLLGDIHAHRDPSEVELATAHYRQALVLAEELGMRPLQAHCHLGLGTLYARTGQRQQARTALVTAIDLYRAMEMTFWLPQAEAALAQVEER